MDSASSPQMQMIVNGNKLAEEIIGRLKREIKKLPRLTIGAVLVGNSPASVSFLKQKARTASFLGINFRLFKFEKAIPTQQLKKEIIKLNKNSSIGGIIIQLPLPKHIKTDTILDAINPKKDIDALSVNPLVLAPTIEAARFIFKKYKINPDGKKILIIGKGRLVGRPIYNWLSSQESSRKVMIPRKLKIIDIKQKNQLPKLTREADIIISGVGRAGLIKGNMIKKNSVLVDFGFSRTQINADKTRVGAEKTKISGDFEFESCVKKAKLITPVPGGMGPIMVAMLFRNLLELNKKS